MDKLPQTLTSYSPCFRKEKGAHGIEERGVYRIHQFEKQEMVVVCRPEESMDWYEKMWRWSVELFRSLDIPVRQLECCSGDLADLKVKSCDIEALTPTDGAAARLAEYGRLLLEQNQVMNLTAITEPDQVADLHFLDSAALLTLGEDLRGKRLIDVGTGAGFPGLPPAHPGAQPSAHPAGQPGQAGELACLGVQYPGPGGGWSASTPGRRSRPWWTATGTASTTPCPGPWPPWSSCASCVCPI